MNQNISQYRKGLDLKYPNLFHSQMHKNNDPKKTHLPFYNIYPPQKEKEILMLPAIYMYNKLMQSSIMNIA